MSKPRARGQHFIPAFLLRRFASRIQGSAYLIYLFRYQAEPREVSVKDVAKEADFYGHPDRYSTERNLGDLENAFAPWLTTLTSGCLEGDNASFAARFVSHMIARTKYIRESASTSLDTVLEVAEDKFKKDDFGPRWKEEMLRLAKEESRKAGLPDFPDDFYRAILEAGWYKERAREIVGIMRQRVNWTEVLADSHRNALAKREPFEPRARLLEQLHWRVVISEGERYILGDCGPIARFENKPDFVHPMTGEGTPSVVVMPVSASAILVGEKDMGSFSYDAKNMNRNIAELSRDFFVSACCSNSEKQLHTEFLRKRSELLSANEIEDLFG